MLGRTSYTREELDDAHRAIDNEVELLTEARLNNGGVFRTGNVVKWVPEQSVLGLQAGDRIRLTADDLGRPATAFLVELEDRFLQVSGSAARPGRRPWRPRRGSPAAGRAPSRCSGPGWPSSAR